MKQNIINFCHSIGLDTVGMISCRRFDELQDFLMNRQKNNIQNEFEENDIEKRINPMHYMEDAKTIISIAFPYYDGGDTSENGFSIYTKRYDYHRVVRNYLDKICAYIESLGGKAIPMVDSNTLPERDIAYLALQAKEKLNRNGAVEPSVEMISNEIHVPIKDVACALEAISEPISLYETVYHDDDDSALIMDQLKDTTTEDAWVEQRMLKDALENIGERERQILFLRYFCGKTQIEISNEIGISQAQVSRLEKSAISQIRNITA